jgi:hypothetical protein
MSLNLRESFPAEVPIDIRLCESSLANYEAGPEASGFAPFHQAKDGHHLFFFIVLIQMPVV